MNKNGLNVKGSISFKNEYNQIQQLSIYYVLYIHLPLPAPFVQYCLVAQGTLSSNPMYKDTLYLGVILMFFKVHIDLSICLKIITEIVSLLSCV
jgi:hypothetical protein